MRSQQRRPGGRTAHNRIAVLAATCELLKQRRTVTLQDVATRSGVHLSSIYRNWGSLEAVVVEAALSASDEHLPLPDTGTLARDLSTFLLQLRNYVRSPLGLALLRASQSANEKTRLTFWSDRVERAGQLFARAAARGEIESRADWAPTITTAIAPLYFHALVLGRPMTDSEIRKHAALLLTGLSPGATYRPPKRGARRFRKASTPSL